MIILIDINVLADIPSGLLEVTGVDFKRHELCSYDDVNQWIEVIGRGRIKGLLEHWTDFWIDLKPYLWARQFVWHARQLGTVILTASDTECLKPDLEGVKTWAERTGLPFDQWIFGNLSFFNRPGVVYVNATRQHRCMFNVGVLSPPSGGGKMLNLNVMADGYTGDDVCRLLDHVVKGVSDL